VTITLGKSHCALSQLPSCYPILDGSLARSFVSSAGDVRGTERASCHTPEGVGQLAATAADGLHVHAGDPRRPTVIAMAELQRLRVLGITSLTAPIVLPIEQVSGHRPPRQLVAYGPGQSGNPRGAIRPHAALR
jgi:hypothetical protein